MLTTSLVHWLAHFVAKWSHTVEMTHFVTTLDQWTLLVLVHSNTDAHGRDNILLHLTPASTIKVRVYSNLSTTHWLNMIPKSRWSHPVIIAPRKMIPASKFAVFDATWCFPDINEETFFTMMLRAELSWCICSTRMTHQRKSHLVG